MAEERPRKYKLPDGRELDVDAIMEGQKSIREMADQIKQKFYLSDEEKFPPAVRAGMAAHRAVRNSPLLNRGQKPKALMTKWLEAHEKEHGGLSPTLIRTIVTVFNWDHDPGPRKMSRK